MSREIIAIAKWCRSGKVCKIRVTLSIACFKSRWLSHVLAIYPGSFDPITLGHLDIIKRASNLYDRVIVAVLRNPNKTPLFTVAERVEQIRRATSHIPNLEIDSFEGLTVNYAKLRQAKVLLRGLRVLSDFEMELQMAHTNKTLSDQIETVFLATSNEYSFLSSSLVKEIARFGGSIDHLVPQHIASDIYKCYAKTHPASALITDLTPAEPTKVEPPTETLHEQEA
jgi:pantetheine-phosphate adenylyltransferase